MAEFHAQLPRALADAIGAAYARYSSRYQDSVVDQIRTILADALKRKVFIPLEYIFIDLGVRGAKSDRPGLNSLRKCIESKAIQVAYFFSTNRLFRKTYRSLQFVEEQIVERGIRAIFVKSGVDTAEGKRWRGLLNIHAMMDEFVVSMTVDHIRAAHEGLLEKRLVFGTISFGYTGIPLDGQTTRRGRPRRTLAKDPIAAGWVKRVFQWYVVDRCPIDEIVRRLNADPMVPPRSKSSKQTWTHDVVRKLLRNSRYRGWWKYGETEVVWDSSKDYAKQITRREPLKQLQIEELRLIPDEQWFTAQVLLAKEAGKAAGRKPLDGERASRPRVLNGLFYCPVHDRKLYVVGVKGKYMVCKDCRGLPADERPLFSQLPRVLALRMTCEALAERIRQDADYVAHVIDACRRSAAEQQAPDAEHLNSLGARIERLDKQVRFILRNPGDTDSDKAESESELRRVRKLRADLQLELNAAQAAASTPVSVPTEAELNDLLAELGSILVKAASEPDLDPTEARQVRDLIDLLTGGRIDLVQMGERRAHGGWLRGEFQSKVVAAVAQRATGVMIASDEADPKVCIDFRAVATATPENVAQEVIGLYESGKLIKEIARRTGLNRNAVAHILDNWYSERGLERADGRSRRSDLATKHVDPPTYRVIADKVKESADRGVLFGEIAETLDLDRNTVTAAWRFWHESRSLPVPDGRGRRKTLVRKTSARSDNEQPPDRQVDS